MGHAGMACVGVGAYVHVFWLLIERHCELVSLLYGVNQTQLHKASKHTGALLANSRFRAQFRGLRGCDSSA